MPSESQYQVVGASLLPPGVGGVGNKGSLTGLFRAAQVMSIARVHVEETWLTPEQSISRKALESAA